jgi:hypothetical protein
MPFEGAPELKPEGESQTRKLVAARLLEAGDSILHDGKPVKIESIQSSQSGEFQVTLEGGEQLLIDSLDEMLEVPNKPAS